VNESVLQQGVGGIQKKRKWIVTSSNVTFGSVGTVQAALDRLADDAEFNLWNLPRRGDDHFFLKITSNLIRHRVDSDGCVVNLSKLHFLLVGSEPKCMARYDAHFVRDGIHQIM
jgi:hypothetical protein